MQINNYVSVKINKTLKLCHIEFEDITNPDKYDITVLIENLPRSLIDMWCGVKIEGELGDYARNGIELLTITCTSLCFRYDHYFEHASGYANYYYDPNWVFQNA